MRSILAAAILAASAVPALAVTAVNINPTGLIQGDGIQVVTTGTVSCTPGEHVNLNVIIRQRAGKNAIAFGQGSTNELPCVDGLEDWTVYVSTQTMFAFRRGLAIADVDAAGCDQFNCTTFARANAEISLRKR